jgi:signal transduction histidine kinase
MAMQSTALETIGLAVVKAMQQSAGEAVLINLSPSDQKPQRLLALENISRTMPCEIFTDFENLAELGEKLDLKSSSVKLSFMEVDGEEKWGDYVGNEVERVLALDDVKWEGAIGVTKLNCKISENFEESKREYKEAEERLQFENVLRQAKEDAEKAHRSKSIFLENISQELKAPIDGIIGFIDVLFQTCLDESQKEILRLMQNSSKNVLWILNDIMDATEIYGGAFTLQNHLFDLYQIIFDVADVTNLLCISKDIDLDIVMKGYVPQYVIGDSMRVKQILSNVMTNAAKYSDEGFVKLVVSYSGDEGLFNFSVHDSGIGIAQDDLQKIFARFSRIEETLSGKTGSGAGLGLSMCKALAHLMSGSISVSSVVGKGSNFIVQLKLGISDQEAPSTL